MPPIQLKRGRLIDLISINPIPAEGEIVIDLDSGNFKIGDGARSWIDLGYANTTGDSIVNHALNHSLSGADPISVTANQISNFVVAVGDVVAELDLTTLANVVAPAPNDGDVLAYITGEWRSQAGLDGKKTTLMLNRQVASAPPGPPTTLASGELFFNESDRVLYYGLGTAVGAEAIDGVTTAESVLGIAGPNFFATNSYVDAAINDLFTTVAVFASSVNVGGNLTVSGPETYLTAVISGTWSATPIGSAYGGTGLSSPVTGLLKGDGTHYAAATPGVDYLAPVANPPAAISSNGSVGTVSFDATHFYICIAPNTWRRIPHYTW